MINITTIILGVIIGLYIVQILLVIIFILIGQDMCKDFRIIKTKKEAIMAFIPFPILISILVYKAIQKLD
jgi:hypothetical protein